MTAGLASKFHGRGDSSPLLAGVEHLPEQAAWAKRIEKTTPPFSATSSGPGLRARGVPAKIFPEKIAQIFECAHRAVGVAFTVVDFPSDLIGGWMPAEPIRIELKKSAALPERLKITRGD